MRKYFEYPLDQEIEKKLIAYYNESSLEQHGEGQQQKTVVKLERVEKLIEFKKNDLSLDVGCSRGTLLTKLSNRIQRGVGLDISQAIIDENRKNNRFSNIEYYVFDGKEITLDEKFDKIVFLDVLEHAFYPDQLLESAKKNLKGEGRIIIEVPFSGWLSELLTKKYHQGHLRYYDPKHLVDYLRKFGLEVEHCKTYNSVLFSQLWLRFKPLWKLLDFFTNLIPVKIYPYFGEIIVVAKKI